MPSPKRRSPSNITRQSIKKRNQDADIQYQTFLADHEMDDGLLKERVHHGRFVNLLRLHPRVLCLYLYFYRRGQEFGVCGRILQRLAQRVRFYRWLCHCQQHEDQAANHHGEDVAQQQYGEIPLTFSLCHGDMVCGRSGGLLCGRPAEHAGQAHHQPCSG